MLYFLDTEFIEHPNTIQLISIGIVSEDGREYYAVSSEFNYDDADEWVKENVLEQIAKDNYRKSVDEHRKNGIYLFDDLYYTPTWCKADSKPIEQIKEEILEFIGNDKRPKFWGYYCDYDWVAFCWIFGKMIDLPESFPRYCRDLKQVGDSYGISSFPTIDTHNALDDAKWNKSYYEHIKERQSNGSIKTKNKDLNLGLEF